MTAAHYSHLLSAQSELAAFMGVFDLRQLPETVQSCLRETKRHIDAALEPVDDKCAAGLLRDAKPRLFGLAVGSVKILPGAFGSDECLFCGKPYPPPIDPLNLSGTLDADQLGEAETVRTLSDAQGRIKAAISNGHDHRSGQFDPGHEIETRDQPRMDGTDRPNRTAANAGPPYPPDPYDGLTPADGEGYDEMES